MSTAWDFLAAIGAACGVPSLAWQVWTWKQSGPRIKVTVRNVFPIHGLALGARSFQIAATNHGGAAAEVTGSGIRLPDGSDIVMFEPMPGSDGPGRIESQGQRRFFYPCDETILQIQRRGFDPRPTVSPLSV